MKTLIWKIMAVIVVLVLVATNNTEAMNKSTPGTVKDIQFSGGDISSLVLTNGNFAEISTLQEELEPAAGKESPPTLAIVAQNAWNLNAKTSDARTVQWRQSFSFSTNNTIEAKMTSSNGTTSGKPQPGCLS